MGAKKKNFAFQKTRNLKVGREKRGVKSRVIKKICLKHRELAERSRGDDPSQGNSLRGGGIDVYHSLVDSFGLSGIVDEVTIGAASWLCSPCGLLGSGGRLREGVRCGPSMETMERWMGPVLSCEVTVEMMVDWAGTISGGVSCTSRRVEGEVTERSLPFVGSFAAVRPPTAIL